MVPSIANAPPAPSAWRAEARLRFSQTAGRTSHWCRASAPLKWQRAFLQGSGHCELPLLHTAGGLVGGDQLRVAADLEPGSRALITSVAAQKVYGTVGRSQRRPAGSWAEQQLSFQLHADSDLEWLPQELVLYADALYAQELRVELESGASFLAAEIVRLGRTAAGERLGAGRWRSAVEIRRNTPMGPRWQLVDRLELGGACLDGEHGLGGQPVFGSLVWAAPEQVSGPALASLLEQCRNERAGLEGEMAIGALEPGLVARYRGPSSQAARYWFTRIWRLTRAARGLAPPELPRVWPFQETPFAPAALAGPCGSG